jgi:hypothetical protein
MAAELRGHVPLRGTQSRGHLKPSSHILGI